MVDEDRVSGDLWTKAIEVDLGEIESIHADATWYRSIWISDLLLGTRTCKVDAPRQPCKTEQDWRALSDRCVSADRKRESS
ncbi:MAG: hypothetical protein ACREQD_15325, partial [Candidatus Binataceae bacterium]